jgi:hypothetical protein
VFSIVHFSHVEICGARSIGALMRLSFNHVEALQILDLPNLIQHCAQCFATSLASDSVAAPFECEKMQDSLAVQVSHMFIFLPCSALVQMVALDSWAAGTLNSIRVSASLACDSFEIKI